MTKLAKLIAQEEGFGVPGAVPTTHNNPGDLRHSPHSSHLGGDPNAIGTIDTVEHGWADLERQLQIYAQRGLTLRQMVELYAPPSDGNRTEEYLRFVCAGLFADMTVARAMELTVDPIGARTEEVRK